MVDDVSDSESKGAADTQGRMRVMLDRRLAMEERSCRVWVRNLCDFHTGFG